MAPQSVLYMIFTKRHRPGNPDEVRLKGMIQRHEGKMKRGGCGFPWHFGVSYGVKREKEA